MAGKRPKHVSSSVQLHTLPNALLTEIASHLSITNLKTLAKVNRKLRFFAHDYLIRYRYSSAFWALPNEIILEISHHLQRQKDCSNFAQSCWKLYPVIIGHVSRQNVRYGGSSLLNYAATRNLKAMARRMLRAGADIETRCGISGNLSVTPLAIAAHYGHKDMVEMLLEAGARRDMDGSMVPLVLAIRARQEKVAILLSQNLDASTKPLQKSEGTVLQMASELKLPYLVRHYLGEGELQVQPHLDIKFLHNLSAALLRVLLTDYNDGDILKRTLDDDACKVVWMLLQRGASPDIRIQSVSPHVFTARTIASRHPDPRIRNLLSANLPSVTLKRTCPVVGRPWMTTQGQSALIAFEPRPNALLLGSSWRNHLDITVKRLKAGGIALMTVNDFISKRLSYTELALNASDIAEIVRIENSKPKKQIKFDILELPMELLFPQLAYPNTHAHKAAKEFWANKPIMVFSGVAAGLKPHPDSICTIPWRVKPAEKSTQADPFPQLAQVHANQNDTSKDIWARFSECKDSQLTGEGKDQATSGSDKHAKRRKWRPLIL